MAEMVIGDKPNRPNQTLLIPPWTFMDDPPSDVCSYSPGSGGGGFSPYAIPDKNALLQQYFLWKEAEMESEFDVSGRELDAYSTDKFRMYEFKIKKCTRGRSHDWTECPFAHPGEKARRRDPKRYYYSGTACAEFRKGSCKKGDACEFSHGVFECWLHPARYRTQPCKDGTSCRRRVCFFAHTAEQLRVLPQQSPKSTSSIPSYDGSPLRQAFEACAKQISYLSSPGTSPPFSPPIESPPQSPMIRSLNRPVLQIGKVVQSPSSSSPWNVCVFGCPEESTTRSGFCSLPDTPTRPTSRLLDFWELGSGEGPAMERVESGRDLRARMLEKLRKENSVGCGDEGKYDWVSELLE